MKEYVFNDEYESKRAKVIKYIVNEQGCFICVSHSTDDGGYPQLKRYSKYYRMHRYVYELKFGKIPNDLVVRHKCDNCLCINPNHLELGTQLENIDDMIVRNRNAKGSKSGNVKLNEDIVREILMYPSSVSNMELEKIYKVTNQTISNIRSRKSWKHVTNHV